MSLRQTRIEWFRKDVLVKKKTLIIVLSIVAVIVIAAGVTIALLYESIFHSDGSGFRDLGNRCSGTQAGATSTPSGGILVVDGDPTATPDPLADVTPEPTPTVDPYETLYAQADTSMMQDIVNILLVGVDYSTERETWSGKKEWHSDAMLVLAVNFDENRADLISLPRDTYAKIPDVKGIYKLNAAINCGGGLYNEDGTFNPNSMNKLCETAEWMLGGIQVDYYYAVTMTSLKQLVDAFGGLDYDLDITFNIQGRYYTKGMQHMDGQAFLDYCRVRKSENGLQAGQTGDSNRVNRQKRILVALFSQLKASKLITSIPDVLNAFDGEFFTNCTVGQTAALAAFAYQLDPGNVGMYSLSGSGASLFQWSFVFTDQENRKSIIKDVYGVEVSGYSQYTLKYARYRWCDMLYEKYIELCTPLTKYVQPLLDADDLLPEFTSSPTPTDTPTATAAPSATATPDVTTAPTEPDNADATVSVSKKLLATTPEPTRQYTAEQRELFEQYKTALKELDDCKSEADKEAKKARNGNSNQLNAASNAYISKLAEVQDLAIKVATAFKYTKVTNFTTAYLPTDCYWSKSPWAINYGKDKEFNEYIVDFN